MGFWGILAHSYFMGDRMMLVHYALMGFFILLVRSVVVLSNVVIPDMVEH